MKIERRQRRSVSIPEATHFQLLHCSERFGLPGICLSDDRGILISSAHNGESSEEEVLAAYAPLLYQARHRGEKQRILSSLQDFIPRLEQNEVSVRRFHVEGQPMFLCALGRRGARKDAVMLRAIGGLRRILH